MGIINSGSKIYSDYIISLRTIIQRNDLIEQLQRDRSWYKHNSKIDDL